MSNPAPQPEARWMELAAKHVNHIEGLCWADNWTVHKAIPELAQAFAQLATEARDSALDEVIGLLNRWSEAYPESVFTPLPKHGTPEQDAQDNVLVTRASAQMGRHMSQCLIEDVTALKSPSKEPK